ncbi:MAG: hypothetical protein KTR21_02080 [Rhodobacteraceae bacterium]|nr:hypothetical protein [Paracoccaceae bacterium]
MPAPVLFTPLTVQLLAVGAAALVAAAMRTRRARASVARDDVLDEVEEGVAVRSEAVDGARQATVEARSRRVLRWGRFGPGVEIDLSAALRGRVRPVK